MNDGFQQPGGAAETASMSPHSNNEQEVSDHSSPRDGITPPELDSITTVTQVSTSDFIPPIEAAIAAEVLEELDSLTASGKVPTASERFDYEILEVIAKGGMGIVYKARQRRLRRIVALKMILSGQFADQGDIDRFHSEAKAAAALLHPNIVAVHEIGEIEGHHFYSMDFIEGKSLGEVVRESPLDPRRAAELLKTIAETVHYAHKKGIIHRDLKPANILLDAGGQPKLTDFGLARRMQVDSRLTGTGQILGTPSYMSPEQARGSSDNINEASDVFSLGATLYYLLAGRPPFFAAHPVETIRQVIEDEPVPLCRINPRIPRDLETIALKCLQKEPSQRYASSQELADDLQRYLDGQPIWARPAAAPERVFKWVKRNRALSATIAALTSAVVLSLWFLVYHNRTAGTLKRLSDDLGAANTSLNATANKLDSALDGEAAQRHNAKLRHYGELVDSAYREWSANRLDLARRTLRACRWDFRGWEYAYLSTLFDADQSTLYGHTSDVTGVAFSPNGELIASGANDLTVKLWDAKTGRLRRNLTGARHWVSSVAFSPDSRFVAAGSFDCAVRIWSVETGQLVQTLRGPTTRIYSIAFSPDGARLAAGSGELYKPETPGEVVIWDVGKGKTLQSLKGNTAAVTAITFTPNGEQFVTGSADRMVRIYNARTGIQSLTLTGHEHVVSAVAFRPETMELATASWDGTWRLWDARTGKQIFVSDQLPCAIQSIAFNPEGNRLVSGGRAIEEVGEAIPQTLRADDSIRIWDVDQRSLLSLRKGHAQDVLTVAFSPNGQTIASGSKDATVKLWPIEEREAPFSILNFSGRENCLAISTDEKRVAFATRDNDIAIWDAAERRRLQTIPAGCFVRCIAYSPNGQMIAAGGQDGTVRIWRARTGQALQNLPKKNAPVTSMVFSPDSTRLALSDPGGPIRVVDISGGTERLIETKRIELLKCVTFSPSGGLVAAAAAGGAVVWDGRTGQELFTCEGHAGVSLALAWSHDEKWLATCASDATLRVWDATSGRQIAKVTTQDDFRFQDVAFTPDGSRVVATSLNGSVRFWETNNWQQTFVLRDHSSSVVYAEFSRDGKMLVTGGSGGEIIVRQANDRSDDRVLGGFNQYVKWIRFNESGDEVLGEVASEKLRRWDARTGEEGVTLTLSSKPGAVIDDGIGDVAVSYDGTRLASRSKEGNKVLVWDTSSGALLYAFPGHAEYVYSLAFSRDGKLLASGANDQTLRIWDLEAGKNKKILKVRGWTTGIAFSADGYSIAGVVGHLAGAEPDCRIHVWDVESGGELRRFEKYIHAQEAIAFSNDGTKILTAGLEEAFIRLWDVSKGTNVLLRTPDESDVSCMALSHDGRWIAIGCRNGSISLRAYATGREEALLTGHVKDVRSLAFSPLGDRLVSCGSDSTIRIWNLSSRIEAVNLK